MRSASVYLHRAARAAALAAAISSFVLALPARAAAADPGLVVDLNWVTSAAEQDRIAASLSASGARWVRVHVQWRHFEPAKGVYNEWHFDNTRRAIRLARGTGARVLVMAYDAPAWASGSPAANAPRDGRDFADFLRTLAARYRGEVDAYEIWNEPNTRRFWSTGPSGRAYAELLKAAYPAVKAADPAAKVVFGGTSTNDFRFVEEAYEAGVKGYFDVLGTHPYTYCGSTGPGSVRRGADGRMTPDSFLAYRELRRTMVERNDARPIWVTEFGWTTATRPCDPGAGFWQGGVSEETQASYLARAFELFERDPYVEVAIAYSLRNNYWQSDEDEAEARYGLMRTDMSPKPAFSVFHRYASLAKPSSASPVGDVHAAVVRMEARPDHRAVLARRGPLSVRFDGALAGRVALRRGSRVLSVAVYRATPRSWRPIARLRPTARGYFRVTPRGLASRGRVAFKVVARYRSGRAVSVVLRAP